MKMRRPARFHALHLTITPGATSSLQVTDLQKGTRILQYVCSEGKCKRVSPSAGQGRRRWGGVAGWLNGGAWMRADCLALRCAAGRLPTPPLPTCTLCRILTRVPAVQRNDCCAAPLRCSVPLVPSSLLTPFFLCLQEIVLTSRVPAMKKTSERFVFSIKAFFAGVTSGGAAYPRSGNRFLLAAWRVQSQRAGCDQLLIVMVG